MKKSKVSKFLAEYLAEYLAEIGSRGGRKGSAESKRRAGKMGAQARWGNKVENK